MNNPVFFISVFYFFILSDILTPYFSIDNARVIYTKGLNS
jgi:uncharacterized membrane protein